MNRLPHLLQTNIHLTEEQLYSALEGSPDLTANSHLLICPQCRSELQTLTASLANFRIATTNLAAKAALASPSAASTSENPDRRRPRLRPIWAASFATAAALLTLSLVMIRPAHHVQPVNPPANTSTDTTLSDEALLDGIQQDLSTSIPPSLAPLALPAAPTSTTHHD